ncbi:class I SAM-dependent methyltransferase [Actinoplanes sp. CA-054009]
MRSVYEPYWDTIGAGKTFTHPVDFSWLPPGGRIVDYGCGYGRVTALAREHGFAHVEGYDPSAALIERARRDHPGLPFHVLADPPRLPHPDGSVDAVLLIAVLTCVPSEADQRALIAELARVLRPGGLLYVSDLLLQVDDRNIARYERDAGTHGPYGTFRTDDGATLRHHSADWLERLILSHFATAATWEVQVETMNAHPATALQLVARKAA